MADTEFPSFGSADSVQQHVGGVSPCGLWSWHGSQGLDLLGNKGKGLFHNLCAAVPSRNVLLGMTRVCRSGHGTHPRMNWNLGCGELRACRLGKAKRFDRCVLRRCGALNWRLCWAPAWAEKARGGDHIVTAGMA